MRPRIKLALGHVCMLIRQTSFEHFVMAAITVQGAALFPVKAGKRNLLRDSGMLWAVYVLIYSTEPSGSNLHFLLS